MKTKYSIIALLLLFLFCKTFANTDSLEPLGHWAVGPCQTITADSSYIFTGNGSLIEIFDFESPDTLIKIEQIQAEGPIEQLEIRDSLLFVFVYDKIISIYNITDPINPNKYSSTKFDKYINQFHVRGNYIYITVGSSKLCILDVNDPSAPILVSERDIPGYPWGISVVDSLAYVGVRDSGLMILDINDPDSIVDLGRLPIHNDQWVSHIYNDNDMLYIGTQCGPHYNAILRILDISDPAHPVKRGKISLGGDWASNTHNIYVEDSLVYVTVFTDVGDYLRIINASDSANLCLENSIEIDDARDVFVQNKRCYVAAGSGGLKVYDWNPVSHTLIYHYLTNGSSYGICVEGENAFIASSSAGIRAVDISDPGNPQTVGYFDEPTVGLGSAYDIDVEDDYAYVINVSGPLNILDISDPENISEASWLHGPYGNALCVENDHIYVANRDYGLFIANISDPLNPVKVCTLDVSSSAYDITVKDTLLFLACAYGGTKIINISDPGNPMVMTTINTTGCPLGVSYEDDVLYVAERENGLKIYNISDPINPIELGHYCNNSWFSKVQIKGNVAFVTDSDLGLIALDVQDPDSIMLLTSYKPYYGIGNLFLNENMIYATAGRDGFYIFNNTFSSLENSIPNTLILYQNHPNPFNPITTLEYELPEQTDVKMTIYNILGQKIKQWSYQNQPVGTYEITWNGTDQADNPVPSGVYIYRMVAGEYMQSRKMLLLK